MCAACGLAPRVPGEVICAACFMAGVRRPAPAPAPPPRRDDVEDTPGEWVVTPDGELLDPDGQPWLEDEDPPGIDVRDLPVWRPRRPVQRRPPAPPAPGVSRASKRPRGGKAAWTPLPPVPPATPWRVTVDVAVRTLSPNRLRLEHWRFRANRVAAEHRKVKAAFERVELPPIDRGVIVTLTRVAAVRCDTDRLAGSLAAVRDAIADLYGSDDSHRAPIEWRYEQWVERVKEPHEIRERMAGPRPDGTWRPARQARTTWRYRVRLRVTVETTNEHAAGRLDAACSPGEVSPCAGRAGSACGR